MVFTDDIAQWRVRVFSTLLPIVLVLGTSAALPSIALALRQGLRQIALMDAVALAWIFAIWRLDRLPHTFRVLNFLAVLFMVAIGLMLAVGPVSLNYLMAPPIMAVILLGNRPGILTLALGALCIVAFGMNGYARLYVPGLETDPLLSSLVVAINFSCVGALVTFAAGTLFKGLARSVQEARTAADAVNRLAFYDVLTGLPNRRLLMDRLAELVEGMRRGSTLGAVLYVDIDNFKNVNDARGHAVGDQLLRQAAERLASVAGAQSCVARLGGDEFVVLLDDLGPDADAATVRALALAEEIRGALCEKMIIEGQRYYATTSIGVALTSARAPSSVHDLLREADTAMYHAKARGRNGVALFEAGMLRDAERRLTLERDLGLALEHGELSLHLQLQVDGARRPSGAELLMRWRRKDGSSVPPDQFIPVAESSGLIVPLGEWVLREACLAWHALARAGHPLPLSVNVSPMQFRQPDFVARVESILQETGVPPGQLVFEITEGLLVDRLDQTVGRMHELAALGVRISVDDFGTGYSSLAYLTRMPLYELKIDKSFIRDTPHDKDGTAIVQSILSMAGHLGLRVVAEGVETEAQAGYLARHGNASMQGFLFHRPMPLEDLLEHLRWSS
ncbi:putative bifunctional diguanylate cyclase/phosphodiesterase [Massilia oculi]|uniref:putative bifunctional diguanylate cyclase/phosphodiesterase n=1 Tax=Massilia oculi TaxID=945844 RepID=UPI0028ADA805|nr:bifunctional diguanylate cyclase/phosphodiesterase [Massilia oculi]